MKRAKRQIFESDRGWFTLKRPTIAMPKNRQKFKSLKQFYEKYFKKDICLK